MINHEQVKEDETFVVSAERQRYFAMADKNPKLTACAYSKLPLTHK